MKKLLLSAIFLVLTGWCTALAAQESLLYGYCGNFTSGLTTNRVGVTMKGGIEIPETKAAVWVGNRLTQVKIAYGRSQNMDITLCLAYNLDEEPFYTQEVTMTAFREWSTIELESPYEIEGKRFFIYYTSVTQSYDDTPIGVDRMSPGNPLGNYAGSPAWEHLSQSWGNVCLRAVIEGDNLPQYDVSLTQFYCTSPVKTDTDFSVSGTIRNNGVKAISSLSIICRVGDGEPVTKFVRLNDLGNGETSNFTISGLRSDITGLEIPVTITIDRINGYEDAAPDDNTASATFTCYDRTFRRNIVVEEGTGTWCQWCVRGYIGMEHMRDTYTDGSFIGIAIHNNDEMSESTYSPFFNKISGLPGCTINRKYSGDPSQSYLESCYKSETAIVSFMNVDFTARYNEQKTAVIIDAKAYFVFPEENADYRLAFVLTENNVGPYYQANAYAGGSRGVMGGFENKPSYVSLRYNDVARVISNFNGIRGSLPSSIKNGEYTYQHTMSLSTIRNKENFDIIVLLINGKTGVIENAVKHSAAQIAASVGETPASTLSATGVEGAIVIDGSYKRCDIYRTDGSMVRTATGEQRIAMERGLYLLRFTDGNAAARVEKVWVK